MVDVRWSSPIVSKKSSLIVRFGVALVGLPLRFTGTGIGVRLCRDLHSAKWESSLGSIA